MSEPVYRADGEAPEMKAAVKAARQSFKYFWRELSWERMRIIPALDIKMIKCPFTDGPRTDGRPDWEIMWVDEVEFDGETLSGNLINSPNFLSSIKKGDTVHLPFSNLSDWIITMNRQVYGGFTVNAMRAKMNSRERTGHDNAWGLHFGDPAKTRIEIKEEEKPKGFLSALFGGKAEPVFKDHPMCVNALESIESQLKSNPSIASNLDDAGFTLLHREALAGNFGVVKLLVQYGADVQARTPSGRTASELARGIGWPEISDYLNQRDAGPV